MAKLGRYDVEIEYLDEQGNVWDSCAILLTDDLEEATAAANKVTLKGPYQQVSIWMWDENEEYVEDSWVVKEFS